MADPVNTYIGAHSYWLTAFDLGNGDYTVATNDQGAQAIGDDQYDFDLTDGSSGNGEVSGFDGLWLQKVVGGDGSSFMYTGYTINGAPVLIDVNSPDFDRLVLTDDPGVAGTSGTATLGTFFFVTDYTGTAGDDVWVGSGIDNLANGNDGNDTLSGGAGADTLDGGNDKDTLAGGSGDDSLAGGNESDVLYGNDGADALSAGNWHDTLYGGAGNDALDSGSGNDSLFGGDGNDNLAGRSGADALWGGSGDDVLSGGTGVDTLAGSIGSDTFVFSAEFASGVDVITDFTSGADSIQIAKWVTNISNTGALTNYRFAAAAQAENADDRIVYDSSNGHLYYDADGSGAGAQVQIATLSNLAALTASDIVIV